MVFGAFLLTVNDTFIVSKFVEPESAWAGFIIFLIDVPYITKLLILQ